MLQTTYKLGSIFTAIVQTQDNRINTSVAPSQIRHLFKFTNDMDKSVQYAYSLAELLYDRYSMFTFVYFTPNVFFGFINFLPVGYWKYEVYEVAWATGETVILDADHAPANETQFLGLENGIVQGLVTKGKMYVASEEGEEQVQYVERESPASTNYIYQGE